MALLQPVTVYRPEDTTNKPDGSSRGISNTVWLPSVRGSSCIGGFPGCKSSADKVPLWETHLDNSVNLTNCGSARRWH